MEGENNDSLPQLPSADVEHYHSPANLKNTNDENDQNDDNNDDGHTSIQQSEEEEESSFSSSLLPRIPQKTKRKAKISSFLMASGNITEMEEKDENTSTDAVSTEPPLSSTLRSGTAATVPPPHRALHQYQQPQPCTVVTQFKDHFSLSWPSSTIRYRSRAGAARVIETEDFQIILEESPGIVTGGSGSVGGSDVLIRRVNNTTLGVKLLRGVYLVISTFWTGTLLVFAVQVLLLIFVQLAIEFGLTGPDAAAGKSVGSLFAIIPLLRGFSHLLALSGAFVVDTFRGHHMIRQVILARLKRAVVEWIFFLMFLGLPLFVMCCALLAQTPHWWEITGLLWIVCIMIMYLIFVACTLYHEIQSSREVIQKQYPECNDTYSFIQKAIQLRQRKTFSGVETISYVAIGTISGTNAEAMENHTYKDSYKKHVSPYSHLTTWSKVQDWGLYEKVESQRIYEIEEVQDIRRYVTSFAWSLDRVFCNASTERSIIVFKGPGAVTRAQMRSTAVCAMIGALLISLLALSALVYMAAGTAGTVMFLIVFGFVGVPRIRAVYRVWKATSKFAAVRKEMKSTNSNAIELGSDVSLRSLNWSKRNAVESISQQESEGVQIGKEIYRVSRPTNTFAYFLFGLKMAIFLVWPFISLLVSGNIPLAIIFLFLSFITTTRHLFDAALALEETGQLDVLKGASEREVWSKQSRLNTIIEKVTRGKSRKVWRHVLALLCFIFLAIFAATVAVGTDVSFDEPMEYLPDWKYEQPSDSVYPTCDMQVYFEDSPLTSLTDFAFLAFAPYRSTGAFQEQLDNWFVGMGVTDQVLKVDSYRSIMNLRSQVSFNLVTVPTKDPVTGVVDGEYAYILIRGSISPWDFLADAQIWGGTILFQLLREFLPFGDAWNPIIPHLVKAITRIESRAIDEVSFYKDTRQFVELIKSEVDDGLYKGVALVGHSLGGGLAIINGAQEGVKSFALSGVNAMLTRKSLDPAVSPEDLDKFTFNVIPERDIVAKFDDHAKNIQEIRCTADESNLAACHDAQRSICEIMYSCGSGPRPALCDCYSRFGYPPPTPKNGTDLSIRFEDVCLRSEL
eukprot:scaffold2872_cov193-Amphora_coffeaeformis.AAC.2